MPEGQTPEGPMRNAPGLSGLEADDSAWMDVLSAVDRTYADLVDYQERLERQNHQLEDMRLFLGSVLASVSDALIVVSRRGRVEEVSASVRRMLGAGWAQAPAGAAALDDGTQMPVQGVPVCDLVTEGSRAVLDGAMALAANTRRPITIEVELRTATTPEPMELAVSPRLDERDRLTGYVLTGRPLGELRQAYKDLNASHEALKAAQAQLVRNEKLASLGRLLAGVAHELNNPISFVYANAHALERYAGKFETYFQAVQAGASRDALIELRETLRLDREVRNLRDAVGGAKDGAERVRDIVEDLRRLSSDGTGRIEPFDLVATARVAADWVGRGARHKAAIRFAGADTLVLDGRQGHVQQVVMNLVQNAIDALEDTADPQIMVRVGRRGDMAVLDLRDNGPGVAPDLVQAIFDPFFTTKEVGRGTGLGLSISHKIAEEHGGRLRLMGTDAPEADMAEDAGLCGAWFRLELPLRETTQDREGT